MNPYLSWAIVLVVTGSLGWYYKQESPSRTRVTPTRSSLEKGENVSPAKKPKRQTKKPKDVPSPSAVHAKQELHVNTSRTTPSATVDAPGDAGADNLQFAKDFAKVKNGDALSVASSSSSKKSQKKTQRIKAGNDKGSQMSTSASSTTGADADDDMSSVESPLDTPVGAAGDVSDMLETAASSASVLRITGSAEDELAKKKKQNKQKAENFKVAETKKQRQQRIKRENNRAMVQEAEQQRRNLLEKQLHVAREHERREAQKSKPSSAPNAWAKPPLSNQTNGVQQPTAAPVGLLDTFDGESQSKPNNASAQPKGSKSNTASTEKSWASDLPSEEEQIRMLSNMNSENEWTTVSSKKKDKKKDPNRSSDNMSETSSEAPSAKANTKKTPSFQPPPAPPVIASAPTPASAQKSHPLDSDWTA